MVAENENSLQDQETGRQTKYIASYLKHHRSVFFPTSFQMTLPRNLLTSAVRHQKYLPIFQVGN